MSRTDHPRLVLVALGFTLTLAGCGAKSPGLQRVHGTVTHAGKPVPRGVILFDPDVAAGNRGPQGFAMIKDGRYDTSAAGCRGAATGPVVARIDGSEPVAGAEDATTGDRPLFASYQERFDLPAGTTEKNFDVPAGATP